LSDIPIRQSVARPVYAWFPVAPMLPIIINILLKKTVLISVLLKTSFGISAWGRRQAPYLCSVYIES